MKLIKAIGYGIFLWIIMFAVVCAFIAFKVYDFNWTQICTALIAGIVSFVLAGRLKPDRVTSALTYGLIFVVTGLVLDILISMKFNSEIFNSWSLWTGYALVLLAPILRTRKSHQN